jgi:hypothetical protein
MPDMSNNQYIWTINIVIDFIFFLDIVLNFRTTYFSRKTGDEIHDPRKITRNYVFGGKFLIDLLASIPIDIIVDMLMGGASSLQLFGLLKLTRILRLGRIIAYMRTKDDIKMTFKLIQLMIFLFGYVHLVACVWFIIVNIDAEWMPPTDFVLYETEIYDSDVSIWWQYWISFYTSVFLLVGGEIGPRNSLDCSIASIMIICGAVITAVMFGEMAVLMTSMNRKSSKF